jgi:hypothetical protein
MVPDSLFGSSRCVAAVLGGLLAVGAGRGLIAQQGNMGRMAMGSTHVMAGMQPVSPPGQLPAPIRMTGIGNGHIGITASLEAQAWFDVVASR